eukprot:m.90050 g.90050  ORF g.90050 m.90050 type:complete len:502 (+) comp14599_c0_seq5:126-1631(+)
MESGSDTVVLTLPSTELNEDQSSDTIATSNVPADSVVSIHTDLLEAASDPLYGDEHSPLLCEVRVEQTQTTFNGTITSSLQEYWTTRYNRFVANTQFLGAARRHCRALRQGAQVPRSSYACEFNPRQHPLCAAIVQVSAEDDLNNFNWMKQGKVSIPQRLIAKVIRHTDQDLQEINTWLQRILRPWGRIGSSFPLHPRGDYDFASIVLAFILYKLDDATDAAMAIKSIIASRLLPARVTRPMLAVPRTAGSVLETENHLLMINGTFYLKALYDARQSPTGADGDNHSVAPDVQAFLLGFFTGILETGLWEYNSLPYLGYFMMALLIVYEAAPPSPLKDRAREVLDMLAYTYALGSLEFRRNAPFRRRLDYANRTHLRENALSNMMMVCVICSVLLFIFLPCCFAPCFCSCFNLVQHPTCCSLQLYRYGQRKREFAPFHCRNLTWPRRRIPQLQPGCQHICQIYLVLKRRCMPLHAAIALIKRCCSARSIKRAPILLVLATA